MAFLYRLFMIGQPVVHNLPAGGSKNGHNNFFGVWLKPKAACPHYAGIRFQEMVEGAFGRMTFLAAWALFAAAGFALTGHLFALAIAALPALILRLLPFYQRQLEMRGQSVESYIRAVHYGENYDAVELANGVQLANGRSYRRGFKGQAATKVAADLRRWRGWAKKMCSAFERDIKEWL